MEKDLKELEFSLRKIGSHQKAEEVNSLFQDYLRHTKMTKNASLVKIAEMPKTEPWPDQADENITYYIELNNQNPEQSTYFGLYKVDARSWQQILGRLGSGAAGALAGANVGGSAGDIASSFAEGAGASQGTKDLADSAVGIAGTIGGGVAGGWAGSKLFDWISKFFRRPFLKATLDQTSNTWKLDGDKSQGLKILADASSKLTGSDQAIVNKFKSIVESSSNQSQQSGTGRSSTGGNVTQAPARAPVRAPAGQTNTGQSATGPTPRQTGSPPKARSI